MCCIGICGTVGLKDDSFTSFKFSFVFITLTDIGFAVCKTSPFSSVFGGVVFEVFCSKLSCTMAAMLAMVSDSEDVFRRLFLAVVGLTGGSLLDLRRSGIFLLSSVSGSNKGSSGFVASATG